MAEIENKNELTEQATDTKETPEQTENRSDGLPVLHVDASIKDKKHLSQHNHKRIERQIRRQNATLLVQRFLGFETNKSINRRKRILKNIVTAFFVVFAVGVLFYTAIADFSGNDLASWNTVVSVITGNGFYLLLAILSIGIYFITKGLLRFVICLSVTKKLRLRTCMEAGVVCQFYNFVTPLAMGGQPFEIAYLTKKNIGAGHASSISISVYLVNMFTCAILFLLAILAYNNNWIGITANAQGESVYDYFPTSNYIYILAIIGTVISLLMPISILIFSVFPKLGSFFVHATIWIIAKLKLTKNPKLLTYKTLRSVLINAKSIKKLLKKPITLLLSFLCGFAEQLAYASIAYFTLRFFGFNWDAWSIWEWIQVVTIVMLITAAASFIPTPGSSGAADFSFYQLFSHELLGGLGFTAMFIWRTLSFYFIILFGFLFIKLVINKETKRALNN